MSFYADYLRERTSDEIIETKYGFATYRFLEEKTCYLIDIFVAEAFRGQGVARDLADLVVGIAKAKGCVKLLGSVVPSTKGSTTSLKVLLGYGMTLESCTNDFILFKKELI